MNRSIIHVIHTPMQNVTSVFLGPPSSLVSPKRVIGCRGGSRQVEGCWGIPCLKIKKLLGLNFQSFEFSKFQHCQKGSNFHSFGFQFLKATTIQNYKFLNSPKSRCVGHTFPKQSIFPESPNLQIQKVQTQRLKHISVLFFNDLMYLGVTKDTHKLFRGSWTLSKIPKS